MPADSAATADEAGAPWPGSTPQSGAEVTVEDLAPYRVTPGTPLRAVIAQIDRGGEGLALVIDGDQNLLGTVTDGDLRRGLLAGIELEQPVEALLEAGSPRPYAAPITASRDSSPVALLRLMGEHMIRHVPLVDSSGRVSGLALLSRFVRQRELPLRAVIMAGGGWARA